MTHHSATDNAVPSTANGAEAESGTAPLSLPTTPPTTAPASAAMPDQSTAAQPRKPSDPFPYTFDAFTEWFTTCSRTDRFFAPFVAFCGGADGPEQTGPYKGQRVFKPHGGDVSIAALFIPLSMVPMGLGAFAFFVLAYETGVQPSSAAFTRWVSEAWWASVYLWCGGLGVVFSFFVAAAALSLVWMAGYPLGHLAFDGLNLFPKRIQLTFVGTSAVFGIHSLLLHIVESIPLGTEGLRLAYATPTLAVAVDWWLEALLRRVTSRNIGAGGGEGVKSGGTCGCSG
ncbi:hypothetical protein JCM6882_002997 [Rhodosporidiobolus microsporus]